MIDLFLFLVIFYFFLVFLKSFFIQKNKKNYTQTTIHKIVKNNYKDKKQNNIKVTQLTKRLNDSKINILICDEKAYWIKNNIFYESDTYKNKPIIDSAKPVDIKNMSKKELDKMLFIVDNLTRGDRNDSIG